MLRNKIGPNFNTTFGVFFEISSSLCRENKIVKKEDKMDNFLTQKLDEFLTLQQI